MLTRLLTGALFGLLAVDPGFAQNSMVKEYGRPQRSQRALSSDGRVEQEESSIRPTWATPPEHPPCQASAPWIPHPGRISLRIPRIPHGHRPDLAPSFRRVNRLIALMLTLATAASTVAAAPRIALVDVRSVYHPLPSTAALRKEITDRQSAILLDHRAEELRKAIAELQDATPAISEP